MGIAGAVQAKHGRLDPKAKQGHSRMGDKLSSNIFGAPGKLGLDFNNGHVGRAAYITTTGLQSTY